MNLNIALHFDNIPDELKQLKQWAISDFTKEPFNPLTLKHASTADPETWSTFDEALKGMHDPFILMAFALSKNDPYVIIDLDNRSQEDVERNKELHGRIINDCASYTESSLSGRGHHIITRAKLAKNSVFKQHGIEVYGHSHFFICTGNVVINNPIRDCQVTIDELISELTPIKPIIPIVPVHLNHSDNDVINLASRTNGKFHGLFTCSIEALPYPSASEADYALISILCYYSSDDAQVERIFLNSAIAQRKKAQERHDYVRDSIKKARSTAIAVYQPPQENDFTLSAEELQRIITQTSKTIEVTETIPEFSEPEPEKTLPDIEFPDGLIGETAQWFLDYSIRPVPEIAFSGALAFVAGICGRAFNISNTGLNFFLMLVAQTGMGKEGAKSGIDRLFWVLEAINPLFNKFRGAGDFASGPGLCLALQENPCCVSIIAEGGLKLREMSHPKANQALQMLQRVLLDVYHKSGHHAQIDPTFYSDKKKNISSIRSPCPTLLWETTPESLYDSLDVSHIASGLLPRFLTIEYRGLRPPENERAWGNPPAKLVHKICDLADRYWQLTDAKKVCVVKLDSESKAFLKDYSAHADQRINEGNEIERHMFNRAHLKALKLAALLAVSKDCQEPIICLSDALWAVNVVNRDISGVVERFRIGDIGLSDERRELDVKRVIKLLFKMNPERRKRSYVPDVIADKNIIPYSYFSKALKKYKSFLSTPDGKVSKAIKDTLDEMVKSEQLIRLPVTQTQTYKLRQDLYILGGNFD